MAEDMHPAISAEPAGECHQYSESDTRWSRVNAAEAFPGIATPLAWQFFGHNTNRSWRLMFERLGLVQDGQPLPLGSDEGYLQPFFGRSAINVDRTMACMSLFPNDMASDHSRELFSETSLMAEHTDRSGIDVDRLESYTNALPAILAEQHAALLGWWQQSLAALAAGEADPAQLFDEAGERYLDAQTDHSANSTLCAMYFAAASKLAEEAGLGELATKLTTGFGDTFDTRSMAFLWDVSRGKRTLADYRQAFGFQTSRGDDIAEPSWREDDAPLRALLKSLEKLPDDASPLAKEHIRLKEREAAEHAIIAALPEARKVAARDAFDRLAQSTRDREMGKASYKIALDVGRAAARVMGRDLHARGCIDAAGDVLFLTIDEATSDAAQDLREPVGVRKAAHARYAAVEIDDAWVGNPKPLIAGALAEGLVTGLGASGGIARGRVRLVLDHNSAEDMEPGDILVTRTTDPSWGPFFMVAGGLVIDIGGKMSHGAIIARELGIPCVINTKDGTRRLTDGIEVEVNGDTGMVTVL
jgi:phosphohistidine swiveling domain-containing protein